MNSPELGRFSMAFRSNSQSQRARDWRNTHRNGQYKTARIHSSYADLGNEKIKIK